MTTFHGSYLEDDVEFLLEVDDVAEISVQQKEDLLRQGVHYGETLTREMDFDAGYLALFREQMEIHAPALGSIMSKLTRHVAESMPAVLVSLARAGTPYGVILKRLLLKSGLDVPHFSISVIKERGIDKVALGIIINRYPSARIIFVDGWTGQGQIRAELQRSMQNWFSNMKWELLTAGDIASVSDICGTREDILLPSCMLNATVSGLISRTLLPLKAGGLHRVKFFSDRLADDVSCWYVDRVVQAAETFIEESRIPLPDSVIPQKKVVLAESLGTWPPRRVKPGIGETTRALIRRRPERIIVQSLHDPQINHLLYLSRLKQVPVEEGLENGLRSMAILEA